MKGLCCIIRGLGFRVGGLDFIVRVQGLGINRSLHLLFHGCVEYEL